MQFPSPPWILIDSLHKQIIRKLFKSNTVYNYHHNLLSYYHRTLTILSSLSVQFSYSVVSNSATPWTLGFVTPGFPVHHQLPELSQTHVHQVGDAIQLSHPLSSPSPPTLSPSQHQGLFK